MSMPIPRKGKAMTEPTTNTEASEAASGMNCLAGSSFVRGEDISWVAAMVADGFVFSLRHGADPRDTDSYRIVRAGSAILTKRNSTLMRS